MITKKKKKKKHCGDEITAAEGEEKSDIGKLEKERKERKKKQL